MSTACSSSVPTITGRLASFPSGRMSFALGFLSAAMAVSLTGTARSQRRRPYPIWHRASRSATPKRRGAARLLEPDERAAAEGRAEAVRVADAEVAGGAAPVEADLAGRQHAGVRGRAGEHR